METQKARLGEKGRLTTFNYLAIFAAFMFSIISLGLSVLIWLKIQSNNLEFNFSTDANYTLVLTVVSAFLASFSVLSIFSIFNTNVDSQKHTIDELIQNGQEIKEEQKTLSAKTRDLNSESKELDLKMETEIKLAKVMERSLYDLVQLNILVNQYSGQAQKNQAIVYFCNSGTSMDPAIMHILINYFESLSIRKIDRSIYQIFKNLVIKLKEELKEPISVN